MNKITTNDFLNSRDSRDSRDSAEECAICLGNFIDPYKACSNGHIFCRDCVTQLVKPTCPLCRLDIRIPDIMLIPYTDMYEIEYILSNKTIKNFINDTLKYEKGNKLVSEIFNYETLTLLTSAKRNQSYILYKPVDESLLDSDNQTITLNNFTTWKLERLNNKIKYSYEVLVKIEVPCDNVLIDIDYCMSYAHYSRRMIEFLRNQKSSTGDVVILSGEYKVLDIYNDVMDLTYFVPENRDKLAIDNRTHIYFISIDKLKYFCKVLGISRYTKMNRDQLVDSIIRRVTERNVLSVGDSLGDERPP